MHLFPARPGRPRRALGLAAVLAALGIVPATAALPAATAATARPASTAPVALATAPSVGAHDFDAPIFSADARGDITTIGNVTTTCDPTYENDRWSENESTAACLGSVVGAEGTRRFDGVAMPPINNRLSMGNVDVDGDPATFNSSTARLALPSGAEVLWAGLHWNAAIDVPAAEELYGSDFERPPADVDARFRVRFDTPAPGGAMVVDASGPDRTTSDAWDDTNPGGTVSYGAFVDVTDQVRAGGAGTYTVANVQSCRGFGGCFGSWSLTVVLAHPDLPPRNLNVWHGWELTTPTVNGGVQQFAVHGIVPPPSGAVAARIGVVQADGDRGLGPDSLEISSPSQPGWRPFTTVDRPLNPNEGDWFNSTVNAYGQRRTDQQANPNLRSNLNHDIALVEDRAVIGNADTSFRFRVRTDSTESLYSQVVHSAVDLYEPEIAIDKAVSTTSPVATGTEVTWTLDVRNVGADPIRDAVVVDPLPNGVVYVPGSVRVTGGGPASLLGPKTDAAGDDQVDVDVDDSTITMRIGAGADGDSGGTLGVAPADDGSHQVTIIFRTVVDLAPGGALTNEAVARGLGRELDDPFGPLTTEDRDPAEVTTAPSSDLGIAKTDGDATVRAVGDRFTYTLTATNAGPSPATQVAMTDRLHDALRYVGSDDDCVAAGQDVTCGVGDLGVGQSADRTFTVEVVALPASAAIPNVAVVDGREPNPDCVAPTPDAECNADDEETPIEEPEVTSTVPATTSTTVVPTTTAPRRPGPRPHPTPTGWLPRTGGDVRSLVAIGLSLTAGGAALAVARRRRREAVDAYVRSLGR